MTFSELWNGVRGVPGWLTILEAATLYELAGGKRVLEIGSFAGRSASVMSHTADSLTCVDSFEMDGHPVLNGVAQREALTDAMLRFGDASRYRLVENRFAGAVLEGPFDFIFIDASHDLPDVLHDIQKSQRHLAEGGAIALHDYGNPDFPGVAQAADRAFGRRPDALRDTLAVYHSRPTAKPALSIITPCSRPENLVQLHESLAPLRRHFEVVWFVGVDMGRCRMADVPPIMDYCFAVTKPKGEIGLGCSPRNVPMSLIRDGWLYFLDDDNLIHPEFGTAASAAVSGYPEGRCFVFNQLFKGEPRLSTGRDRTIGFGLIDTGSFMVHRSIVGRAVWRYEPGLCEDFVFVRDIHADHAPEFVFIDEWVTNYNELQPASAAPN